MGASIDLRKAHLHRAYGDLLAVWSWFNDDRALFLIPRYRQKAPWFVVLEPAAHEWFEGDRSNFSPELTPGQVKRLARLPPAVRQAFVADLLQSGIMVRAAQACHVLGIEPSQRNCHRIIGIVNDAIPELVAMPHRQPPEPLKRYGEIHLAEDGKVIASHDLTLEDEGATYG